MPDPDLPPELDLGDHDIVESVEVIDDHTNLPSADRVSGWDGLGTRREGRERALALLFESEQRGNDPLAAVLTGLPVPPEDFTTDLVEGVSSNQAEIDSMLARLSQAWPLSRMPAIDRALLRIGAYELSHTEVPTGACISEAVELAKRYSTDDSHRFVNGMLAAVAREVRPDRPD